MPLRSQLPGTSPLTAGALGRGVLAALQDPDEAREALRSLLSRRYGGTPLLLGSGTQSLQAALRAASAIEDFRGRPVAVPAYSCYDIVTACVGAGVSTAFYDIDPRTLTPDLDSLDAVLRGGARVVVAGSLYGLPLDWDALRARVRAVGGVLVEDSAQGLGSLWGDRPGGTFGDATVLSFGRGKGWTGGGGGALLIRDPRLRAPDRVPDPQEVPWGARALVGSVAQWALGRPSVYGLPRSIPALALGETVYKEPTPVRAMAPMSAALALATAGLAEEGIEGRRRAAAVWRRSLPEGPWTVPHVLEGGSGSYLRFPLVTSEAAIRDRLVSLLERFGAARGYPAALCDIEPARAIVAPTQQRALEGARLLAARLFTLPTHSFVGKRDQRPVLEALASL